MKNERGKADVFWIYTFCFPDRMQGLVTDDCGRKQAAKEGKQKEYN